MRTTQVIYDDVYEDRNIAYISYPEACVFVHSRHVYLKADMRDGDNVPNSGRYVILTLTDNDTNVSYSVGKYADQNAIVIFDLSRLLQILTDFVKPDCIFDYRDDSALAQSHTVTIALSEPGIHAFWNDTVEAFNGSDEINDLWWNTVRRLRWWTAYPFTFDYANVDEASIQIDGGIVEVGNFPQIVTTKSVSRLRVNPAGTKFSLLANRIIKVSISANGMLMRISGTSDSGHVAGTSLFSNNVANTLFIGVDRRETTEADVYLRWLNRHGELCYWLFKRYSGSRNVSATESYRAMVEDDRYINGIRDNARLLTRSLKSELTIYTDFLQQWEYEHVASLFDAPFADMLEQKTYDPTNGIIHWNRVHVKAGNHVENLKNFSEHDTNKQIVLTLTMPDQNHIEP